MQYKGRYQIFDSSRIKTYPVAARSNKVTRKDLISPERARQTPVTLPAHTERTIATVADSIVRSGRAGQPVILFTGAHLIKNGLGPLLADLVEKDMLTLVAGNAATAIHDFELAMIGQTSENVPNALGRGRFGMAREFAYINAAVSAGNDLQMGFGEALGKLICDKSFCREVLETLAPADCVPDFPYSKAGLIATCYRKAVPLTIHAGIGTDVTDQHPSFDGAAKGGCSGRDFLIYTNEVEKMTNGGVVINIGSAVTGPEVLLKAVSMAANTGNPAQGIITADFDIRSHNPDEMTDEQTAGYYFRDQKSIVARIPAAFEGAGYYVHGDQRHTFLRLYQLLEQANRK